MMSRSLAVVPLIRKTISLNAPAIAALPSRFSSYGGPPADYRFPTMDDMLMPCGCWQEQYDNNQRRYNLHLIFGVGFFVVTIAVGVYSGALDLYMMAPEKPAPKS